MKLKVVSVATSKKGRVYISTELVEGRAPIMGDILEVPTLQREKTIEEVESKQSEVVDAKES